jgi:hypothetical protein
MPLVLELLKSLKEVNFQQMAEGADVPPEDAADIAAPIDENAAEAEAAQQNLDTEAVEGFGAVNTYGDRWSEQFGVITEELLGLALAGWPDTDDAVSVDGLGCGCSTGNPQRDMILNGFDGAELLGIGDVEGLEGDDDPYLEGFDEYLGARARGRAPRRANPRGAAGRAKKKRTTGKPRPRQQARQTRRATRRNPPARPATSAQAAPRATGLFRRKRSTNPVQDVQTAAVTAPVPDTPLPEAVEARSDATEAAAPAGGRIRQSIRTLAQEAQAMILPGADTGDETDTPSSSRALTTTDDSTNRDMADTTSGGSNLPANTDEKPSIWAKIKEFWAKPVGKITIGSIGAAIVGGIGYAIYRRRKKNKGQNGFDGTRRKGRGRGKSGGGKGGWQHGASGLSGTIKAVPMQQKRKGRGRGKQK